MWSNICSAILQFHDQIQCEKVELIANRDFVINMKTGIRKFVKTCVKTTDF